MKIMQKSFRFQPINIAQARKEEVGIHEKPTLYDIKISRGTGIAN